MFKFKNWADYKNQRDEALNQAEAFLGEGKTDEYNEKVEYVKNMDAAWEEYATQQANIAAMRGAAPAPSGMMDEKSNMVNDDREYRIQFMNYVLNGQPIKMSNANEQTTTSEVGAVIPETILNVIIERMENIGGIYGKMTKSFYQGGVSVPTSAAKPKATWTSERGKTDTQKKPVGSITFGYHKLRCAVSMSVAVSVVTLEVFERTIAKNIADAMVDAIENAAFNGSGTNEPKGLLKETVVSGQTIDITEGSKPTYADLLAAEGALPEAYDAGTEWYMKKKTYFNVLLAMVDADGQPIARTSTGIDGKPEFTLFGRKVNFTDKVPAFATTVTEDTPFAVMFRFEDYMFNTNLKMTLKDYEDNETDDQVKKAIMLADGKAIDLNSLVVMQVKNS